MRGVSSAKKSHAYGYGFLEFETVWSQQYSATATGTLTIQRKVYYIRSKVTDTNTGRELQVCPTKYQSSDKRNDSKTLEKQAFMSSYGHEMYYIGQWDGKNYPH